MTNIEFFVLLGTVLGGVIWQRADVHQLSGRLDQLSARLDQQGVRTEQLYAELSGRIDRIRDELSGRIDRISDDMRQFYRELGRHDKAIENLSANHSLPTAARG